MMTFDECVAQANAGKVCQMMAPSGKWVKFDPKKVINKFRIAPELTPNDARNTGTRKTRSSLTAIKVTLGASNATLYVMTSTTLDLANSVDISMTIPSTNPR